MAKDLSPAITIDFHVTLKQSQEHSIDLDGVYRSRELRIAPGKDLGTRLDTLEILPRTQLIIRFQILV